MTDSPVVRPVEILPAERVPLVDLLDRVLARGVVVSGEVTLSIAQVDLVHLSLRALLCSVRADLFTDRPGTVPGERRGRS